MTQEILTALRNIEDKIMDSTIPKMENCGRYLAEDNKGNWHYLNHAGIWQGYQGPDKKPGEPTSFNWTPSMDAIWPAEYRPTMSGLLAIYNSLRDAAVYDTSVPKPLADDGWIEWGGGRQPVSNDTLVNVKFRNASMAPQPKPAFSWSWIHDSDRSDIIAYRVVSP